MSYTPVELRHVRVGRSLFGYNRAMVEQVIEEVAESFEATWRERGELAERVESLEKQLEELRKREGLLTQTLVAAEQAASDVRERARREAETIVSEAHNEARSVGRAAEADRERLITESRRIEGMLRAALGLIEERTRAVTSPAETPARPGVETTAGEMGTSREDTREFEPIASGQPDPPRIEDEPAVAPPPPAATRPESVPPESVQLDGAEPEIVPAPVAPIEATRAVDHSPTTFAEPVAHGWPQTDERQEEESQAREPSGPAWDPRPVELPPVQAQPEIPQAAEPQAEPAHAAAGETADEDERNERYQRLDPLDQPEPWTAAEAVLHRLPGPESRDFDWGE